MALAKNRSSILVRGLGTFQVKEVSPVSAANFSNMGYLENTQIVDEATTEDIMAETGRAVNFLVRERKYGGTANLLQTAIDELNLLKDSATKIYAIRYHGHSGTSAGTSKFQFFSFNNARIRAGFERTFQSGKQIMPLVWRALKQDTLGYDQPEMFFIEANANLTADETRIWIAPRLQYNDDTVNVLDISGFGNNGVLQNADAAHSAPTGIWGADSSFRVIDFDGVDENLNLGNVQSVATNDFTVEAWVKVTAANGTLQELASKKSATGTSAGWSLTRNASNQIAMELADGSSTVTATSTATVLQNVWAHVAATADRDGNMTVYVNGVASGTPQSISALGSASNGLSTYLARLGSGYGQVRFGMFRLHQHQNGFPDIANVMLNRYNGEKAYFGL